MAIVNALLAISVILMPITLVAGSPFVIYSSESQKQNLIKLACLAFGGFWLSEVVLSVEIGFRNGVRPLQGAQWMSFCKQLDSSFSRFY